MSGILKDPFWRDNERLAENRRQIEKALEIANSIHSHEWRKGKNGLPYMDHIYSIMGFARHVGIPISEVIVYQAIALHDTVESGLAIGVIRAEIPAIAPIVEELTFLGTKDDKPAYLDSFANKSVVALVVKIMDRICNVVDFMDDGNTPYARQYLKMAESLWTVAYYRRREIGDRFGDAVYSRLSKEYDNLANQLGVYE